MGSKKRIYSPLLLCSHAYIDLYSIHTSLDTIYQLLRQLHYKYSQHAIKKETFNTFL